METVTVHDLETVRIHEGLDFVWTALSLDKKLEIADLALMRLTWFPCNCKLTSLNFVRYLWTVTAKILYLWHPLTAAFCVQQLAYKLSLTLSECTTWPKLGRTLLNPLVSFDQSIDTYFPPKKPNFRALFLDVIFGGRLIGRIISFGPEKNMHFNLRNLLQSINLIIFIVGSIEQSIPILGRYLVVVRVIFWCY